MTFAYGLFGLEFHQMQHFATERKDSQEVMVGATSSESLTNKNTASAGTHSSGSRLSSLVTKRDKTKDIKININNKECYSVIGGREGIFSHSV